MLKRPGPEFMLNTRYARQRTMRLQAREPQPPLELPYDAAQPRIGLPSPYDMPMEQVDLRRLIEERSSLRDYAPEPLSLVELAYLCWCTQGVKQRIGDKATFRTVPSAGARHAFETYLLVNRVENLAPGLYRYLALEHALYPLHAVGDIADAITVACLNQEMVARCAVAFIWVAHAPRMTWRYGDRGYRYLHLDAGHICQNLYLASEAIACGACAIAAFDDDQLNAALRLDGDDLFVTYLATVGKRKGPTGLD